MAQHRGRLVHEQALGGHGAVGALRAHDALAVEEAGRLQRLEVAQAVRREGAVDVVARVEDPALGVAEGAGLEPGWRVRGGHAAEK